jgi:hypothetical protein
MTLQERGESAFVAPGRETFQQLSVGLIRGRGVSKRPDVPDQSPQRSVGHVWSLLQRSLSDNAPPEGETLGFFFGNV